MIVRDNVIRSVLRQLGEVSVYNDNRSDIYKFIGAMLEDILDSTAYRTDLKFNSTTVKLTKVGTNDLEENRFNIPVDFLNKIRFINSLARLEGEFIYSDSEEVFLQYCRKIDLGEYPDYMENILVLLTALRVAESYNAYSDRLNLLDTRVQEELQRLYKLEFQSYTRTY